MKNFNSDSRDNSIMNILCTIGENKITNEDSFNKINDKDSIGDKKEKSKAISPKNNFNNYWKNSSLINNPNSTNNFNFNLSTNNPQNIQSNLKNRDINTPKNIQNKFILLDSGKDVNNSNFLIISIIHKKFFTLFYSSSNLLI